MARHLTPPVTLRQALPSSQKESPQAGEVCIVRVRQAYAEQVRVALRNKQH